MRGLKKVKVAQETAGTARFVLTRNAQRIEQLCGRVLLAFAVNALITPVVGKVGGVLSRVQGGLAKALTQLAQGRARHHMHHPGLGVAIGGRMLGQLKNGLQVLLRHILGQKPTHRTAGGDSVCNVHRLEPKGLKSGQGALAGGCRVTSSGRRLPPI